MENQLEALINNFIANNFIDDNIIVEEIDIDVEEQTVEAYLTNGEYDIMVRYENEGFDVQQTECDRTIN